MCTPVGKDSGPGIVLVLFLGGRGTEGKLIWASVIAVASAEFFHVMSEVCSTRIQCSRLRNLSEHFEIGKHDDLLPSRIFWREILPFSVAFTLWNTTRGRFVINKLVMAVTNGLRHETCSKDTCVLFLGVLRSVATSITLNMWRTPTRVHGHSNQSLWSPARYATLISI